MDRTNQVKAFAERFNPVWFEVHRAEDTYTLDMITFGSCTETDIREKLPGAYVSSRRRMELATGKMLYSMFLEF